MHHSYFRKKHLKQWTLIVTNCLVQQSSNQIHLCCSVNSLRLFLEEDPNIINRSLHLNQINHLTTPTTTTPSQSYIWRVSGPGRRKKEAWSEWRNLKKEMRNVAMEAMSNVFPWPNFAFKFNLRNVVLVIKERLKMSN